MTIPKVNDPNAVAIMTKRFAELEEKRRLCKDLMGGTDAMIKAGKKWINQHPAETDTDYELRLKENILSNFMRQAVDKATGKIFGKPMKIVESTPKEIVDFCMNVDRAGRGLDAFVYDRASKAFERGISYILIDMPKKDPTVLTVADEKDKNVKPYMVSIDTHQLLEAVSEMINGVQTLTRVRILESVSVPESEWSNKDIDQIRVFKRLRSVDKNGKETVLVVYEIYREDAAKKWSLYDSGATTFDRITLIAIYTNRVGFMEGEPVFQATAEFNLEHWRSKSEQLHALTFGRFAMLGGSGVSSVDQDKVEVGPSKMLFATDPQGKFYYVESDGVGLEHGWKHLQSVENAISTASAQLRIEEKGQVTATAAAIDSDETNASLKTVAHAMEESIGVALQIVADLLGVKGVCKVELNTNFGTRKGTDTGMQETGKMATGRILSGKSQLKNMIWRGELPPDFDLEANATELAAEPNLTEPTKDQIDIAMRRKKQATE